MSIDVRTGGRLHPVCDDTSEGRECDEMAGKPLPTRFPHQGEEAGSIVFHSSSKTSEVKNDNNEACATASAAAKVSEDLSIKGAEILRLIEERRSTPKEEKQRLKEVSKSTKMYQRQKKNEKANGYPKNSRKLQRCQQHPRNQICKEESAHYKDEE